jgi:hypothetical protein
MKAPFFLLILPFFSLPLLGQAEIKVESTAREMSRGLQPAFQVNVPENEVKEVQKAWERYIRKGSRARVKKSNEELHLPAANISGVQGGNVQIYSLLYAEKSGVILFAFFEIDSVFFNPEQDPAIAGSIRTYLRNFAVETYKSKVGEKIREEEKTLRSLERGLEDLLNEEKSNDKKIKQNQREIQNLQNSIQSAQSDENRKSEEIARQKDLVLSLKNFQEEEKAAKADLKKMERELKKMQRSREGMHRKIDKLEEEIRNAERDIRILQEKQKKQERDIASQKERLMNQKNKQSGIR